MKKAVSHKVTSDYYTKEKTLSIANKVKEKIATMKENEPISAPVQEPQKPTVFKDRSNSSCFHTNPLQTMKSFQVSKEKYADYFTK